MHAVGRACVRAHLSVFSKSEFARARACVCVCVCARVRVRAHAVTLAMMSVAQRACGVRV